MWFVLSGMLCFFIAHLADKYAKKVVADVIIFTGLFMIALAALVWMPAVVSDFIPEAETSVLVCFLADSCIPVAAPGGQ